MEMQKIQELFKQLEDFKKEEKQEKSAEVTELEKVKREKVGCCAYDLRTAFINKIPQGLKERKSFVLNVVKIDVKQSDVSNLIDWLLKNGREDRANEIEANKDRFFDISIVADDGSTELFNSGILSYDKKNSLEKLIVRSDNGFDYYVNTMTWDASNRELFFA